MSKKSESFGIKSVFKWLVIGFLVLVGLKVAVALMSALTVGMALASVALWGLAAVAIAGGAGLLVLKALLKKKKR